MRRTVVTLVALGAAALLNVSPAQAGHDISSAEPVMLGSPMFLTSFGTDTDPNVIEADEVEYLRVHLRATRSYAVICLPTDYDEQLGLCEVSWRNVSDENVGNDLGTSAEPLPPGGDADAFIPASTGQYYIRVDNDSAFNDGNGRSGDYLVFVIETTIFSPWYFVSSEDGYDGFIEVKNTTTSSLDIVTTVYSNTGAVVGTQTGTLNPNGNDVIPVAGNFGVPSGFGSVQIAHLGLFGAAVANITTLSAQTGLSFDAPFETRGSAQAQLGEQSIQVWTF